MTSDQENERIEIEGYEMSYPLLKEQLTFLRDSVNTVRDSLLNFNGRARATANTRRELAKCVERSLRIYKALIACSELSSDAIAERIRIIECMESWLLLARGKVGTGNVTFQQGKDA